MNQTSMTTSPPEGTSLEETLAEVTSEPTLICIPEFSDLITIVALVLGALTILENTFGIIVILHSTTLRTMTYFFVVSLAVSDIIVGFSMVLMSVPIFFHKVRPVKNYSTIQMFGKILWAGMYLHSLVHLAVVAIDRYIFITKPFFYRRHVTKRVIYIVLFCICMVTCSYMTALALHVILNNKLFCGFADLPTEITNNFGMPVSFLCSIIACVAYSGISIIAYQKKKELLASRHRTVTTLDSNASEKSENLSNVMNTVKFFALVFGVTTILTVPSMTLKVLHDVSSIVVAGYAYDIVAVLVFSNSLTNFIIFALVNKTFRQECKKLVRVRKRNSYLSEPSV